MKLDAKAAYATMPPWRLFFTVLMLGGLWNLGLDGIWLNMFGTSFLALLLGGGLLLHVFAASKRKTDYYD